METFSPRNSPGRGSTTSDQSGMLKVKLNLPKPLPFYLMKPENISISDVTGATNLMASKNLEHSFTKLASKKMKERKRKHKKHDKESEERRKKKKEKKKKKYKEEKDMWQADWQVAVQLNWIQNGQKWRKIFCFGKSYFLLHVL